MGSGDERGSVGFLEFRVVAAVDASDIDGWKTDFNVCAELEEKLET
jgi:hypothetical protein